MEKVLKSLNHYKLDDHDLGYLFISKTGREYIAQFVSMLIPVSEGIFCGVQLYNFNLFVKDKDRVILDTNKLKKEPEDERIGETVAFIMMSFFRKNPDQLMLLCFDDSDKRHLARAKKFNAWIYKYMSAHVEYLPYCECFFDSQDSPSYGGLLFKKDSLYSIHLPLLYPHIIDQVKKEKKSTANCNKY